MISNIKDCSVYPELSGDSWASSSPGNPTELNVSAFQIGEKQAHYLEELLAPHCCMDVYIIICVLGVIVNSRSLQAADEFLCCDGSCGFDTPECSHCIKHS